MSEKKRQLTPEQENFLNVLFNEAKGDVSKALKISGLTYSPSAIIKVLGTEIREMAEAIIAMNLPKAALAITGVMDDPNAIGTANKIKAAESVMDRAGMVKKTDQDVKLNTGGGLIVLPVKEIDPDMLERIKSKETKNEDEQGEASS